MREWATVYRLNCSESGAGRLARHLPPALMKRVRRPLRKNSTSRRIGFAPKTNSAMSAQCPVCPRKRTQVGHRVMSA
jgi:hypothetical protein